MAIDAKATYALNLDQCAALIAAAGGKRTFLIEGDIGTGKSTLLKVLAAMPQFAKHVPVYFDCVTKDIGDLFLPLPDLDGGCVSMLPNEELGVHEGKPVILMIDELGKAPRPVQNALLAVMQERKVGKFYLPEGSVVFATTNLSEEGVGDMLPAHARNRISVVQTRKPDNMEWIEWGINNHIHPTILGWVRDNPQLLQSFREVADPENNPYIYHPRAPRPAFVTPRSLHAASDILHATLGVLDTQTVTASLMGALGDRAAMDLMAFVELASELPSLDSIKKNPKDAKVPQAAAAVCMVVYKALATVDATWVDAWMEYMERLEPEAQGLFANGVRSEKFNRKTEIMSTKSFGSWCVANQHMFAADK